jgi:oligo-1,6-glucosidase
MTKNWWKEAVIYQVYPRSFKDSNADGIGDLQGIISKLDYLKELGIDVIWLSPHYQSPNIDNGYDISNYQAIMNEFGTMQDFDCMLTEIHKRGLKLIIDLVVNHSSDQHYWFQESRKSKENHYREYYIWKETKPNNWISFFSGSAWSLDPLTNEYYLHFFTKQQPDINWENPRLRQEVYDMMHFWLKKGVDGFRMDVISLIAKDKSFADFPKQRFGDLTYYANWPKVHTYLREMNEKVLSQYDCMTVGEAFGISTAEAHEYVSENRKELNMIYHFDHAVPRDEQCFLEPKKEFSLIELKQIFDKWDNALREVGWNTVYFGNHDNPRMLSRFGDTGLFRNESAKMLATILLTLRGTPFLYQGDEIGMSNTLFDNIEEFNDIQVLNAYQTFVEQGGATKEQFLEASNKIARDHARTPMQWTNQQNAGFTDASSSWLKLNENYPFINVEQQKNDTNSILNYYKKLIKLRKQQEALTYGTYTNLTPTSNKIWAYLREIEGHKLLVINNFTNKIQAFSHHLLINKKELLLGNYTVVKQKSANTVLLNPYESTIYQIF